VSDCRNINLDNVEELDDREVESDFDKKSRFVASMNDAFLKVLRS